MCVMSLCVILHKSIAAVIDLSGYSGRAAIGLCRMLAGNASFCPPTLVEGDYKNGFVRLSVHSAVLPWTQWDGSLWTQLLLQF